MLPTRPSKGEKERGDKQAKRGKAVQSRSKTNRGQAGANRAGKRGEAGRARQESQDKKERQDGNTDATRNSESEHQGTQTLTLSTTSIHVATIYVTQALHCTSHATYMGVRMLVHTCPQTYTYAHTYYGQLNRIHSYRHVIMSEAWTSAEMQHIVDRSLPTTIACATR